MRTLREWRIARLMGTQALASLSGVTKKTIIDLEYGRQAPRPKTMAALCAALGVEPGEVAEFAQAMEQLSKDAA